MAVFNGAGFMEVAVIVQEVAFDAFRLMLIKESLTDSLIRYLPRKSHCSIKLRHSEQVVHFIAES